jgi:hypothetical protein
MLADAFVVTVPAGNPIGGPGGSETLALIHSGFTRVVLAAPDGRTATIIGDKAGCLSRVGGVPERSGQRHAPASGIRARAEISAPRGPRT